MRSKAICVLGMHRSGTSLIMRVLNLMGVYIGEEADLLPAQSDNVEGFWELGRIVDLHERVLMSLSRRWYDVKPLPELWWKSPEIQPFKNELKGIIENYFCKHKLWGWKDPRTCILLPLWIDILDELNIEINYVVVVRNPLSVSESLKKRDGFSLLHSVGLWQYYNLESLFWTHDSNRFFVEYDCFIEEKEVYVRNLFKWVNSGNISENKIRDIESIIKPSLRHNKIDYQSYEELIPEPAKEIYNICREAALGLRVEFSKKIQEMRNEFIKYSYFFVNDKYTRLQCYWKESDNENYSEKKSNYITIKVDGKFSIYEIMLPEYFKDPIRIDLSDCPLYIEIEFIELYKFDSQEGIWKLISKHNKENHFLGLSPIANIIEIERGNILSLVSLNNDPQLLANFFPCREKGRHKLVLKMRLSEKIDMSLISKIVKGFDISLLKKGIMDINYKIEHTLESMDNSMYKVKECFEKEIDRIVSELEEKKSEIEKLQEINYKLEKKLIKLRIRNKILKNVKDELERKVIDYANQVDVLKNEICAKEDQIKKIKSSLFWKLIAIIGFDKRYLDP